MTEYYVFRFFPVLAAEALVLWRMKWASLPRCLLDSLLMNFVAFLGLMLGLGPYITSIGPWGLTLFCTYSTLVEGTVLWTLEKQPTRQVWLTALSANVVSTLFLALEAVLARSWYVGPVLK